ncbi:MAG: rod shape-determining protein MreC [Ignavibacteriales bacterium]|nr:rod shape-determining protein MreC [Ignavibacteriales bacterium]
MLSLFNKIWNGFKEYIVLVVLLLISLILLSQSNKPPVKKVKSVAFSSFAILTSAFSNIITPFQNSFENSRIKEVNARLMLEVNRLREYGIQNEELKRMLGLKDSSAFPLIAAKIISKFASASQGNFVINAGINENIKPGMPVINDQGLIGIVVNTSKDYASVRTLMHRELKLAIKNQRSRYDGIIEWNGAELIIKNVPKSFDMEVGDRIVTSDFSTKFPPSIPVGVVSGGTRDKTGMFNNIIVTPYVDFIRAENIFVIGFIPSTVKNNLELNLFRTK